MYLLSDDNKSRLAGAVMSFATGVLPERRYQYLVFHRNKQTWRALDSSRVRTIESSRFNLNSSRLLTCIVLITQLAAKFVYFFFRKYELLELKVLC